jgi:hypothetical protein
MKHWSLSGEEWGTDKVNLTVLAWQAAAARSHFAVIPAAIAWVTLRRH